MSLCFTFIIYHIYVSKTCWMSGKQCRLRSDVQNGSSDLDIHHLFKLIPILRVHKLNYTEMMEGDNERLCAVKHLTVKIQ